MLNLVALLQTLQFLRFAPSRATRGQTNVEYALILFMVALATVLALTLFAGSTNTMLSSVNTTMGS